MEYLKFNSGGQWELCKAINPATDNIIGGGTLKDPKDADKPGNTPFRSISAASAEGRLPQDRGTRGALHNFHGGRRSKPKVNMSPRRWGKPTHNVDSVYEDQNPGVGQ